MSSLRTIDSTIGIVSSHIDNLQASGNPNNDTHCCFMSINIDHQHASIVGSFHFLCTLSMLHKKFSTLLKSVLRYYMMGGVVILSAAACVYVASMQRKITESLEITIKN